MPRVSESCNERSASSRDALEAADDPVAQFARRVDEASAASPGLRGVLARRLAEYGAQRRDYDRRRIDRLAP